MKALISGGGIAGLATGIALRRQGLDVEIFERASEHREIGAGLLIWPNGARSLRALDVEVEALSFHTLSICTWRGRRLSSYPLDAIGRRYGFQPFFVHRADLQSALAGRFGTGGMHFGTEVAGYTDVGQGVEVLLRDGRSIHGDFLVGADGLRSPVRNRLLGDGEPLYLGSTIWRGVTPGEGIDLEPGSGINWIGRGSEFLAFHLTGGRIYWAGVTKEPIGERAGPRGHRGDLAQRFSDWVEPVPQLIARTEEAAILRNDMYDRRPVKRWSRGPVAVVGDAAHPMTPNAGQGACQALEDAVALGESFAQNSDVAQAFATYERQRLRRANRVVAMSRQSTRAVQIENPALCALRDYVGYHLAQRLFLSTLDSILRP